MNELPSSTHFQQTHARPKSGEELEMLGKQASARYLQGTSDTLSSAVVETVKKAGLSPEQVKRVIEFANTDAFLQEFRKEGAANKVVEFRGGPANASDVFQDLNDGGGGTVFDDGHDYNLPPVSTSKLAMDNRARLGLEETKLAEAFQVEEALLPFAEPYREAIDLKDKLASARDSMSSELSMLEVEYQEALDVLNHEVKQAALGGTTLGQMLSAWQGLVDDAEYVKVAFLSLTPRLLSSGVFSSREQINESLSKTASVGVVNTEHPLVTSFAHYCDTLSKLAHVRVGRMHLEGELDKLEHFLREVTKTSGAASTAKKVIDAADRVAPAVGGAAGALAETATRYAPHAAAVYAGKKAYDKVEENPLGARVLSHVPGTRPHAIREYYRAAARQGGQ